MDFIYIGELFVKNKLIKKKKNKASKVSKICFYKEVHTQKTIV